MNDYPVPASLSALNDLLAKLRAAKFVLKEREEELLEIKGPCRSCRLHYAHRGPCDTRREGI